MAGTKIMNNSERHLEGKGIMDYDYLNDILFFKIDDREYDRSLEFNNIVVDIDEEDFITGLQIFDASEFLCVSKTNLKIKKWQFKSKITQDSVEIRLVCQVSVRNRIKELSPIIIQQNTEQLPSSQMVSFT